MATFNTLVKQSGWNPYYCGQKIENIHFYDPETAEVLCSTRQGWLSVGGSNNNGCNVLEDLEYRVRRKPFLSTPEPHTVGDEMYVPISSLPNFKFEPDTLHSKFADGQENYGDHITFDCGATSKYAQQFDHLTEVKPRKFLIGCYTRTEYTGLSAKQKALEELAKELNLDIRSYDLGCILKLPREQRLELTELIMSVE